MPFKALTAQQYNECWKERVSKEQHALAESIINEQVMEAAASQLSASALKSPDPEVAPDDYTKSHLSLRSSASAITGVSQISSRVSTSSATMRKVSSSTPGPLQVTL